MSPHCSLPLLPHVQVPKVLRTPVTGLIGETSEGVQMGGRGVGGGWGLGPGKGLSGRV